MHEPQEGDSIEIDLSELSHDGRRVGESDIRHGELVKKDIDATGEIDRLKNEHEDDDGQWTIESVAGIRTEQRPDMVMAKRHAEDGPRCLIRVEERKWLIAPQRRIQRVIA